MSYYETLGVEPDATADDIKANYRRAAAKAHPDKGGSNEEMARVNRAYAVLSDADKRAHYDQTGEESSQPDDAVTTTLAELFDMAISGCDGDVVAFCNSRINDALEELDSREKSAKRSIAKLTKKRDRVRAKGNIENLYTALIDRKLAIEEDLLRQVAGARKTMEGARERLRDYESTYKPPTAAEMGAKMDHGSSSIDDILRDFLRGGRTPFGADFGRARRAPW